MAKINSNSVRGTRDILPDEMVLRNFLENKILKIYTEHGFEKIETPVLENLDLLLNSDGGENLKMIFTILKRGDKLNIKHDADVKSLCDMGLRYDLTLPLSRFYENNKEILQQPFKSIQIDNVYRAEKPQKGRFRSFKQCDIDIIGESEITAEIELINTTAKALMEIGFSDFTIRINDRRILSTLITNSGFDLENVPSVSIVLDKLDKIGQDGVKTELIEKGYDEVKVVDLIEHMSNLNEKTLEALNQSFVGDLKQVISDVRTLSGEKYSIVFDPTLVRGMGYYTGQIFEISYGPYGFSIGGGGRYDNMIGNISNESVPAVGFSIGFERIVTILMEENNGLKREEERIALFHQQDDSITDVIDYADQWRKKGYQVSLILSKKKLSKQIGKLKNFNYFMIYGKDSELRNID